MAERDHDGRGARYLLRRHWKVFPVLAIVVIAVFAGLVFSQHWSRITLAVYNQLEEPEEGEEILQEILRPDGG